jgi:hypothetical protein
VFAPNHRLRKGVTALAIAKVGKQREVTTGGHGNDGHGSRDCCDAHQKPRSPDKLPAIDIRSRRVLPGARHQ